jgi:hypothetical protein
MNRTRILTIAFLLGAFVICSAYLTLHRKPERVLSVQDLNESRIALRRLAYQKQQERAEAEVEAAIRSRCESNETVITLERTPGYTTPGFAVEYSLAICGDGTVSYQGFGCGSAKGIQSARIDPAEVQRLVQAFLNANYFGMADYHPLITDASGAYTSLTLGKRHKSVEDYAEAGPRELKQLEDLVDKVAGSNRWRNIDAAGIKEKVQGGWNVRSPEAGLLLLKAAAAGDVDTVRAFIQEGANANARVDVKAWAYCLPPPRVTKNSGESITPLQSAQGVEVVKALIAAGADPNPKTFIMATPLQYQLQLGDADSVTALVQAGANLEAGSSPDGWTALMWAAHGVNRPPNPAVVKALLRGGAKVNAKDNFGKTVLDIVRPLGMPPPANPTSQEKEVERLLLTAGAKSGVAAN